MCRRFANSAAADQLAQAFKVGAPVADIPPRYNIAPTQIMAVIRSGPAKEKRQLDLMRWGLRPSWGNDKTIRYFIDRFEMDFAAAVPEVGLINLPAESLIYVPDVYRYFRADSQRCIVPATCYWEWKMTGTGIHQPYAIMMRDHRVFGFAGLWGTRKDATTGETLLSCAIITTSPNKLCSEIHYRMPVILAPRSYDVWLGERDSNEWQVRNTLDTYDAEEMIAYPVSTRVNALENDDLALLSRIDLPEADVARELGITIADIIRPNETDAAAEELYRMISVSWSWPHEVARAVASNTPLQPPDPDRSLFFDRFEMDRCGDSYCDKTSPGGLPPPRSGFWKRFKEEFRIFACTDDKKYADLRQKLKRMQGKSQLVVTSAVAGVMAAHLGVVAATALTPLCAICFLVILRLGREAFCSGAPITLKLGDARGKTKL
jgi:putative SOS response-associated peptidase YedK